MSNSIEFSNGDYPSDIHMRLIELLKSGPKTRDQLVHLMHKPRTTIYDNLMRLMAENFVRKCSKSNNCRGRPLIYFKLKEGI